MPEAVVGCTAVAAGEEERAVVEVLAAAEGLKVVVERCDSDYE